MTRPACSEASTSSDHALYAPSHSTSVASSHGLQAKSPISPAARMRKPRTPSRGLLRPVPPQCDSDSCKASPAPRVHTFFDAPPGAKFDRPYLSRGARSFPRSPHRDRVRSRGRRQRVGTQLSPVLEASRRCPRPLVRTGDVRQSRQEESGVPRSRCLPPLRSVYPVRHLQLIVDSEGPDRSGDCSVDIDHQVRDACVGPQARLPVEKRAAIGLILGREGGHSDRLRIRHLLIDRVEIPVLDRPQRDVHRVSKVRCLGGSRVDVASPTRQRWGACRGCSSRDCVAHGSNGRFGRQPVRSASPMRMPSGPRT